MGGLQRGFGECNGRCKLRCDVCINKRAIRIVFLAIRIGNFLILGEKYRQPRVPTLLVLGGVVHGNACLHRDVHRMVHRKSSVLRRKIFGKNS